ncbi:MAG TPA: radical SAM protein [Bacteroidales bacterium]|jgi:wyosine [tRNA(Phe)-imidazoG37] synthetase (radical SAM superfamily)|nr:radical SAM protein [Bacteroidales bacterium]
MSGFLFDEIVFGPVKSRRFGISLGINLLPLDSKLCSYDCIYCECGLTGHKAGHKPRLFAAAEIKNSLQQRFKALAEELLAPDNITFAGNGEPTLHPEFATIIDDTIALRNCYFPKAKITVLSNATMLNRPAVVEALKKIDNNVLKLDAGTNETFRAINRPLSPVTLEDVVKRLMGFGGDLTIQTLFLRGSIGDKRIDNTTDKEVNLWLEHLSRIRPALVMLYPIDRRTPFATLEKVSENELKVLAEKVEAIGLKAEVFY